MLQEKEMIILKQKDEIIKLTEENKTLRNRNDSLQDDLLKNKVDAKKEKEVYIIFITFLIFIISSVLK